MTRKELKSLSKNQLKGHWKVPVLITLAYIILTFLISGIQEASTSTFVIILSAIMSVILSIWATVGLPKFYLEFINKNSKAEYKDALVSKKAMLKSLGFTIVTGILGFILALIACFTVISSVLPFASTCEPFNYCPTVTNISLVGMIIFTILSILFMVLMFALSMTPYIIVDKEELGLFESMKLSIKLMKGNKWKYFVIQLSFIGWAILALIPLAIGFLWLIPYISLTSTNFYKSLR